MTTSTLLLLDKRRPKHDGTFPLLIRIIHNRTTAQITLGIYLLPISAKSSHQFGERLRLRRIVLKFVTL